MSNSTRTNKQLLAILNEAIQSGLLERLPFKFEAGMRFASGDVAMTSCAKQACGDIPVVETLVRRHCSGDFGNFGNWNHDCVRPSDLNDLDLIEDDFRLNCLAVMGHYDSVLSEYIVHDQVVWVKTESISTSMPYTVVLLPSEH